MRLKSCVVRPQQMCRFQAGQPRAAEFKKQKNQLHAGMCWYVMVCASTKCRNLKFEHVKDVPVYTGTYFIHLISYCFIQFHIVSDVIHLESPEFVFLVYTRYIPGIYFSRRYARNIPGIYPE